MIICNYSVQFVISTKEKSSQETRQRSAFRNGAACEDFSFVEMTILSKTLLEEVSELRLISLPKT